MALCAECLLTAVFVQVGFETEGTAIFDTMQYVTNEVRNNLYDPPSQGLSAGKNQLGMH